MHVPAAAIHSPCPLVVRPCCRTAPECRAGPDPLSAPPSGRKLYAPPPVGEPTPVDEEAPPEAATRVVRVDYFYLTPAGGSLNVLA